MFLLAPIVQSLGNFGDINTIPLCYVPFYKSWTSWNKITLDWRQSTTSTRKDPYLASLLISSAQIEDNMNDYIHHIPQWAFMLVLWCDPLRSLCASKWRETSPHQVSANGSPGWHPLPPYHPPPRPPLLWPTCRLAAPQLEPPFCFCSIFHPPPLPSLSSSSLALLCELTSPHITHFSQSQCSIALQIHTKTSVVIMRTHTFTLLKRSSHINGNCMQALAAE